MQWTREILKHWLLPKRSGWRHILIRLSHARPRWLIRCIFLSATGNWREITAKHLENRFLPKDNERGIYNVWIRKCSDLGKVSQKLLGKHCLRSRAGQRLVLGRGSRIQVSVGLYRGACCCRPFGVFLCSVGFPCKPLHTKLSFSPPNGRRKNKNWSPESNREPQTYPRAQKEQGQVLIFFVYL